MIITKPPNIGIGGSAEREKKSCSCHFAGQGNKLYRLQIDAKLEVK
jgi:hypothetical protein